MKLLFLTLTFIIAFTLVKGQDYIVTWNNDTIECAMPKKPAKEGLKPSYKYENGYVKFASIFAKDSIRVIEAGQIKSYKRDSHGKGLLCNGFFDAKKIAGSRLKQIDETVKDTKWHFMQRVSTGPFATLYILYSKASDGCTISSYYFSFVGDHPNYVVYVDSKKNAIRLLMEDADIAPQLEKLKYKKSSKGYIDIVEEYNRLKQEAAIRSK